VTDLSDSLSALSEGVDLGLLGWVKGEIDLAMRQGREALEQAAADTTDQAAIGRSIAHLHQAHGALSVVGLSAVPAVTKALEDLLQALPIASQCDCLIIIRWACAASISCRRI
jgi:chemosensory pili system protein ChpA (sensor histidine kinase/response regulator)